jgi:hypothetical protein
MIHTRLTTSGLLSLTLAIPLMVALAFVGGCPPDQPSEPPPPGNSGLTGKFTGSSRCATCHNNVHSDWSNTLHAHALETLEAIGQDKNSDCVGCHTVGYGEPGGWVDRATTNDLAGVGCEACHGGAAEHANNVNDETLRPKINISADVCGKCHTDAHHPNFEDWKLSKHADSIEDSQITDWSNGTAGKLTSCGKCHSGDYFYHAIIKGETVGDDFLKGKTSDQMMRITCAICHNPHSKTGNASSPQDGRDYQLRYPEVKYTTPTSDLTAVQDPSRFNLCGQCHHARSAVWTDTSREPHPSDQVNVFFGELPLPAGKPELLVVSRASVHLNAPDQCATCHVYRKPFESDIAPTVSGHTFEINFGGCSTSGCHSSSDAAQAKFDAMKVEFDTRVGLVKSALDDWGTAHNIEGKGALSWEYKNGGGPSDAGQAQIPDAIKKARYLYYYFVQGGGNGIHNPDYVRDALQNALVFTTTAP